MRLFFYGTLLDPDVQALVLGRPLAGHELTPAELRHFRRVYVAGQSYPMVLPHRGGAVDGAIADGLGRDELARIALFEGDDYWTERRTVYPTAGGAEPGEAVPAWLYRGRPTLRPSTRDWRLAAWQGREKAHYLGAVRRWLADGGGTH